jgi:hypothetical protein
MNKRQLKKAQKKAQMEANNAMARLGDGPLPHKRVPSLSERERKAIQQGRHQSKSL